MEMNLIATAFAAMLSFAPAAALAALVVEYKFDGNLLDTAPSGSTADNLSARNNAGAIIAVPAGDYQAGIPGLLGGTSLRIGQNTATNTQWVGAPDGTDPDAPSTTDRLTAETFVNPNAVTGSGFNRLVLHWASGNAYHLALHNGKASIFIGAVAEATGGTVMTTGKWYHVAGTYDGTTLTAWLDGAPVAKVAAAAADIPNSNNLIFLGSDPANSPYSGRLDEVRVWDTASTTAYMESRAKLISPQAANPTGGLVTYYRFEGGTDATRLADTAVQYTAHTGVNTDNLTAQLFGGGSATYVAGGRVGQAVDLSNAYLRAPHSGDVAIGGPFTIETWINPDVITGTFQRIVLNWGTQLSYHFGLNGNDVNLFVSSNGSSAFQAATGGDVLAGQWSHIAATYDGTTVRLYLNGLEVASAALASIFATTNVGLGIGNNFVGDNQPANFNGLLDELAIWKTALTPDQIRTHYLAFDEGYKLTLAVVPSPAALPATIGLVTLLAMHRRRRIA